LKKDEHLQESGKKKEHVQEAVEKDEHVQATEDVDGKFGCVWETEEDLKVDEPKQTTKENNPETDINKDVLELIANTGDPKKPISTTRKTSLKENTYLDRYNAFMAEKKMSQQRKSVKTIRKISKNPEANFQVKKLTKTLSTRSFKKLAGLDDKETERMFTNVYNLEFRKGDEQKIRTFTNRKNLPISNPVPKERTFTNRKNLPMTPPKQSVRTFSNRTNLTIGKESSLDKMSSKIDSKRVVKKTSTVKTDNKVTTSSVTKVDRRKSSAIGHQKLDILNNMGKIKKEHSTERKVSISKSFTIKKENSTKKTEVKLRPPAKARRVGTVVRPNLKVQERGENILHNEETVEYLLHNEEEKEKNILAAKRDDNLVLDTPDKEMVIESMKISMQDNIQPKKSPQKDTKSDLNVSYSPKSDLNVSYDELEGIRQYLNKSAEDNTPGTL